MTRTFLKGVSAIRARKRPRSAGEISLALRVRPKAVMAASGSLDVGPATLSVDLLTSKVFGQHGFYDIYGDAA